MNPIRFAVVGCGTAARHIHLPALREAGADVTVFASRTRASAESLCDAWAAGTVVDHWEEAVGRDDVDAVLVATPNANHCEVAVAAGIQERSAHKILMDLRHAGFLKATPFGRRVRYELVLEHPGPVAVILLQALPVLVPAERAQLPLDVEVVAVRCLQAFPYFF